MIKISKKLNYWLKLFGFKKREKSIKEKMCEATAQFTKECKQEAREATAKLRINHDDLQQIA